jgi:hypothetical protein
MIRINSEPMQAYVPDQEEDEPRPDIQAAKAEGRVNRVECWTCGFEPADQHSIPPHRCPKCNSTTWVRFVRSDLIRTVGRRWDRNRFPVRDRQAVRCQLPVG